MTNNTKNKLVSTKNVEITERQVKNLLSVVGNINGEFSVAIKDLFNNSFGAGKANIINFFYYENKDPRKTTLAIIDNGISINQDKEGVNSLTQIGKTIKEKIECREKNPTSEHGFGFKSSTASIGSADIFYSVRDSGYYKITNLMEEKATSYFTTLKELQNDCKKYCPDFKVDKNFRGSIILMNNFKEEENKRGLSLYKEDKSESINNLNSFINYLKKTYIYKFHNENIINFNYKTIHDTEIKKEILNKENSSLLPGESIFKQILKTSSKNIYLKVEFDMRRFKVLEDDNKGPFASQIEERRLIYFNDILLSCPDIKDKNYGIPLKDASNAEIRLFVRILEQSGLNTLTNKNGLHPDSTEVELLKTLETEFLSAKNGKENSTGIWKGKEKLNVFLQKQFKENHIVKHKALSDNICSIISEKEGYSCETEVSICTTNKFGQKLDLVINNNSHHKVFSFAEFKSIKFNSSTANQIRSYLTTLMIEHSIISENNYTGIECFIVVKEYSREDKLNFNTWKKPYQDKKVNLFLYTEEEMINHFNK
jgi:hypothetical protein